jgi:hypothetical protein
MVFEMTDVDDGRLQIQDKEFGKTHDLRGVSSSDGTSATKMHQNHRCKAENDVGYGFSNDKGEIRMITMKNTVIAIGVVLLLVVGVVSGIAMAYPEEPPMAVTMTDINGIPLHQTGQVGQFGIFEVTGGH